MNAELPEVSLLEGFAAAGATRGESLYYVIDDNSQERGIMK